MVLRHRYIVWALTKFITFYHLNYHLNLNMCIHSKTLFHNLLAWEVGSQVDKSKREGNLGSNHQLDFLDHWDCFEFRVRLETMEMTEVHNNSSLRKQLRCIQMLALRNSLDHIILQRTKSSSWDLEINQWMTLHLWDA